LIGKISRAAVNEMIGQMTRVVQCDYLLQNSLENPISNFESFQTPNNVSTQSFHGKFNEYFPTQSHLKFDAFHKAREKANFLLYLSVNVVFLATRDLLSHRNNFPSEFLPISANL
jgi:hypothetical protein